MLITIKNYHLMPVVILFNASFENRQDFRNQHAVYIHVTNPPLYIILHLIIMLIKNFVKASIHIKLLRPPISMLPCPSFICPLRPTTNS